MKVMEDIKYSESGCEMDVYVPDQSGFDTLIYFHGGGFVGGSRKGEHCKAIAEYLADKGYCVVQVDYRLYPNAKYPDFINDAADAVKYVNDHVESWGGNGKIYVTGQSAGAYLSLMLCLNEEYLKNVGIDGQNIAGWIIDSAQTTAHFNVLKEKGLDTRLQRIDESAPLYYVNGSTKFSRMLLIFYTDDMPCRYEQNMLFYKAILNFDQDAKIEYKVLEGTHVQGSIRKVNGVYPVAEILAEFMG